MNDRSRKAALFISGATVGAALTLFLAPAFSSSRSTVAVQKTSVSKVVTDEGKLPTTHIFPADVLGTGVISWSPLTGDGSN